MRVLIEHDEHGNIRSVATVAAQEVSLSFRPQPGHRVTEVFAEHVRAADDYEGLRRTRREFMVTSEGSLRPKDAPKRPGPR